MDEFLTFRQWLKKKLYVDEETREIARELIKFLVFFMGGLALIMVVSIGIPIYLFGFIGIIIGAPVFIPLFLYWIYRLERFMFMEAD